MINDEDSSKQECHEKKRMKGNGGSGAAGAVYFFGFLGAAIYYIQHAATFWLGVLGFLKAIVWPVFLIYKLLEFLKM